MSDRWLAILNPYDPATGVEVPQYLSTHRIATAPDDTPANVPFESRMSAPTITQTLWSGGRLGGGSALDLGAGLSLENGDGGLDDWKRLRWDGRAATVARIAKGQTVASAIAAAEYVGATGQLGFSDGRLLLPLKGRSLLLDRPAQPQRHGPHARALLLNEGGKTSDRLDMPLETNPATLAEWTVECWVMALGLPTAGSTLRGLFFFTDSSAQASISCYYGANTTADYQGVRVGGNVIWNDYPLADGVWRHLALRYRDETVSVVVNGEEVAEGAFTHDHTTAIAGTWHVGDFGTAGTHAFDGAVSRLRVWSSYLELADIRARMNTGLSGGEQHLVADYPIQDGTDVLGTADAYVYDEAPEPLGDGAGAIVGTANWLDTGEAIEAGLQDTRKLLPVGDCPLFEPDLVDPTIDLYRVSSEAHREVRVFEGGRLLTGTEPVDASGGALLIPADSATDFGSGDARSVVIEMTVLGLGSAGKLLHASNGTVLWDWVLGTDGSISLTMTASDASTVTLPSPEGIIEVGGRYRVVVQMKYGGAMRLLVNKRAFGSAVLPSSGNMNPGQIGVGQNDTGSGDEIDASITRVAMFDRGIGPKDDNAKLGAVIDPDDADLVAGYMFSDQSGSVIVDTGPNGIDGTATGSSWGKPDYELTNNATDGCLVRLERPASKAVRVETDGWLPLGHAISQKSTLTYTSAMLVAGPQTFGCWAKLVLDGSTHYYISRSGSGPGYFALREATSGHLHVVVTSDAGTNFGKLATLPDGYAAGDWVHVAGVWDEAAAQMRIFLDGVEIATKATTDTLQTPTCTGSLNLLSTETTAGDAAVQSAFWVNRALTGDELLVESYRTRPFRGDDDLVALIPCSEESGITFDLGPSGFATASTPARVPGVEPVGAMQTTNWLALRDAPDLTANDVDMDSQSEFEMLSGTAPVGLVVRDQTQREAVDALIKPLGWHKFNPAGKWAFGKFWMPDMRLVPEFDGGVSVTVDDAVEIRQASKVDGALWGVGLSIYMDRLPATTVGLIDKENNYRLRLRSDGLLEWRADVDLGSGTRFLQPYIYTDVALEPGRWTHIVATMDWADTANSPIYIDGASVATTSNAVPPQSHSGSYEDLVIGDGFIGKIAGVSVWNRKIGDAKTYRHLLPCGDEQGLAGAWPLLETSGLAAANRVSGGPAGVWSAEPARNPSLTDISGDLATEELSRHTWDGDGQGGVRQLQTALPTARETVAYRVRTDPYPLNELVTITREDGLGVSEMMRPYDIESRPTPRIEAEHLTAKDGPVIVTALQHQDDASRALEAVAAAYGRVLEYYEVRDLVGRWGTAGEQLRMNADLKDGTTSHGQPPKGKNFLVTTLRYENGRHVVRLLGVAP